MGQNDKRVKGAVKSTGGGTHVPGLPDPELYQLNLSEPERQNYSNILLKLQEEGLGEGLALHLLVVLTMEVHRLRPLAQHDSSKAKQFKEMAEQLNRALMDAQKRRDAKSQGESLPKMLTRYMTEARDYIEEHVGEHVLRCEECGSVVTTDGLPHWAIKFVKDDDGEVIFFKWSPEVMYHYENGDIPLHVAAHILRTSPKSLIYTAEKWKTPIRACDIKAEEDKLRDLLAKDVRGSEKQKDAKVEAAEEDSP